jgi:hypothetical protein
MDFVEIGRQAYRNGEPFIAADSDTGREALITLPRGSQAAAAREYADGWRAQQRETNPAEYLTGEVQTAERLVQSLTALIGKTTHARHLRRLRADREQAEQNLSRLVTDLGSAVQEAR